jgi:hypothetical protein
MKKLRLDLDGLAVEGFTTVDAADHRGTVEAMQTIINGTCGISCVPSGCRTICGGETC